MRTRFPLNSNASEAISFLETRFILENGQPVRFESWQKQYVLAPVFERARTRWDTFLIGLPKKNGKSTLAACIAAYALLLDDNNPEVYSTAGDKDQASIIFNSTAKALKRSSLREYFKFYKEAIERADGEGLYRVLAADASGSHGLNASCVIWDELWNQPNYALWEALTHTPTRAHPFHFVVTYAGYQARQGNLLWDLYSRGISGSDPGMYTYWRDGAEANVASWITQEYLESQRRRLPDHIFRRLHWNQWSVAREAKAFRIPADCWAGMFEDAVPEGSYIVGIDLAKVRDFTAWCVLRTDVEPRRVVEMGKLPHMDYVAQVELLDSKVKRFGNPRTVVDAGAAGAAVVELMRGRGMNVEEFRFTNDSKARIVTALAVAFEQRSIILPKAGRTIDEDRAIADLEVELFNFEPTLLKSGNIRYEAAGAFHDDLVMALCLAHDAVEGSAEPWVAVISVNMPPPVDRVPSFAERSGKSAADTTGWEATDGPSRWWRPL